MKIVRGTCNDARFLFDTKQFLIDKQGIVRYIHQVTNPQASVEKEELMREVEQLYQEETQI